MSILFRAPRCLATVLCLTLSACAFAQRAPAWAEARVAADTVKAAARVCADRGFSYVARIEARHYYCITVNLLDEPEAVAVGSLLGR